VQAPADDVARPQAKPAKSAPAKPKRRAKPTREPDAQALVQLHGVERTYQDADGRTVVAARNANLSVHAGQMVALIGPSGLGKSTLLNILGGIDFPSRGTVVHRGTALPQEECAAVRRYRAEEVCFVFQDLNLVTHLTAVENAALPLLCRGSAREDALAEAAKRLAELGLEGLEQRRAHQLSGGQRQRVAIARAFTSRAPLLLADEPTGSLDPETAGAVIEAFARRAREEGRTVVLVTHNPDLARTWCDRIVEVTPTGLMEHDLDAPAHDVVDTPTPREVLS
jgi:ABC-type lipoprotein export system ATPase subunit